MKPREKSLSKAKKKLVLFDAHAVIHRAYHALPDFATASGEPTGALYGLAAMLIKIINELKPDYLVACFDLPGPTYRHEAYEGYKAKRAKTEDALALQLERAKEIFEAFGIPIYSVSGFEADDVIGTIVHKLKNDKNTEVIIASGDMDTLQLVDDKKVQVYTLKRGLSDTIMYDEDKVKVRYGFAPAQLADYKGLRGDPSDNIIGVPGIGEKTATILVTQFGSIENIYKVLKKSPEKLKESGLTDRLIKILAENEEEALFSKTLATIRTDAPIDFALPAPWRECLDIKKAEELFIKLEFRTMGERVKTLLGASGRDLEGVGAPEKRVKTDTISSAEAQDPLAQELCLALWVIDSNLTNPTLEDVFRFSKTKDLKVARQVIEAELDKRGVRKVFEEIERPLMPVVEAMNARGVKVDASLLTKLSKDYHKELNKLEKKIWQDAGEEFNVNSPKVLSEILFTKLELGEKRQKKTPTGAISTKESELEKLRNKHPIIGRVLEYRELQKLLSTYIDAIPPQLDADSRLHSSFIQAGTTTGRMASNSPNLQNIPIKTELGRAIREAFIAEKGFQLLSLDYSQIELRLAAILSGDPRLIEIFKNSEDIHKGVAERIGVERYQAKTINFGILYGMGVNALKVNLDSTRAEAQEFLNQYFITFSRLAEYIEETKREAERKGYTETIFGRRRYFAGFRSPLPYVRAQAERMAVNAPLQGTQADIIKIAMKRIDDLIKRDGIEARLILQIHDEIVYEVKEDEIEEVAPKFKEIMETVLPLEESKGVPIIAEAHLGDNWGELK